MFYVLHFLSLHFNTRPSRTGRNGTISVRALDGPKASIVPSTYYAASPPGYTILDVDANAMLFVGGLTGKLKVVCSFPCLFISSLSTVPDRIALGEGMIKLSKNSATFYLICLWKHTFLLSKDFFFFQYPICKHIVFKPVCIYLKQLFCPYLWHQFFHSLVLVASRAKCFLNIPRFLNQFMIYWYEVL